MVSVAAGVSRWRLAAVTHADVSPGGRGLCPFLTVRPSPQPSAWDGGRSSVIVPKRVESLPPSPPKGSAGSTRERAVRSRERAVRPAPQRVTRGAAEGKGGLDAVEPNQAPLGLCPQLWPYVPSTLGLRNTKASLALQPSLNESRRARGRKCAQ